MSYDEYSGDSDSDDFALTDMDFSGGEELEIEPEDLKQLKDAEPDEDDDFEDDDY